MDKKQVVIVGCGPIGLTGALLLAQHGIKTLLLEKRSELNTHPRSRFVDTYTMELMRSLGIEKKVENTGLGPDWTAFNRWSDSLCGKEYAAIASPTFHTVPRSTSPCVPVMTCQDYVEAELLKLVQESDLIDVQFHTEASNISQSAGDVALTTRDLKSGAEEQIQAQYLIGADGRYSQTRKVIGSELETDPLPMQFQDVIFDANLSDYVGDRKGGLLYCATSEGVSIFQPLNGIRRWRCQIVKPLEVDLSKDEILGRLRLAIGADDVDIKLTSVGNWQPTPGCVSTFGKGRIFLAGDAAHITVPTGGMGNNIGFLGIRNLAWKIAYVIKGISNPTILDTYETELRRDALNRIAHGLNTTSGMRVLIGAIYSGDDVSAGVHATRKYADYDGILMGHEIESNLVATEVEAPPAVDDPVKVFIPSVRSGRRAPHIWVEDDQHESILDWNGTVYTVVIGQDVDSGDWQSLVDNLAERGFPIQLKTLPGVGDDSPYNNDDVIIMRPDSIIADHWRSKSIDESQRKGRLEEVLPMPVGPSKVPSSEAK